MAIAKYVQAASDRKRRQIDYSEWLDTGEQVQGVVFAVDQVTVPPLVIDDVQVLPTGLGVQYYTSGGVDGQTYRVTADLETTMGPQQKLVEIFVSVREP